ncbi:MAG: hypothetical protein C0467_25245 [Planctomycetaceae bacterium]|nr:hypothetical protein [Planctomycetaceae bacterium]
MSNEKPDVLAEPLVPILNGYLRGCEDTQKSRWVATYEGELPFLGGEKARKFSLENIHLMIPRHSNSPVFSKRQSH